MVRPLREKQERIVEAVRHGLEGEAAVEFVRENGFAMTTAGIARHLRVMGGRGQISDLIAQGRSNVEILEECFPEEDLDSLRREPPTQGELFVEEDLSHRPVPLFPGHPEIFDTVKVSVKLPSDLYEAIRLAARAEGKSKTQLITEILTSAHSRTPLELPEDSETADSA
jgi:hypothetical protein